MNTARASVPTHTRRGFVFAAAGGAALLTACSFPTSLPGIGRAPDHPASRDYRRAAANHLYSRNRERIYPGVMPPMLYAIGVLQLDLDRRGQITRLHWLRAPSHAPEVVAEIERTVRGAAPFPAPGAALTYTETWLWDSSGRFQLDTLTEGQR